MTQKIELSEETLLEEALDKYINSAPKNILETYVSENLEEEQDELFSKYINLETELFSKYEKQNIFDEYLKEPTAKEKDELFDLYLANASKERVTTEVRSDVQIIAETIVEDINEPEEVITDKIIQDTSTNTGKSITTDLIKSIYNLIVSNAKPLFYSMALLIGFSLALIFAYSYISAGSWMMFLTMLRNLGINVIPGALYDAVKTSGIAVTKNMTIGALLSIMETNPRLKKILNSKIAPKYLRNGMNRLGLAKIGLDPEKLTMRNFSHVMIDAGISVGTGGIGSFLVSQGIGIGINVSVEASKATKHGIEKVISTTKTLTNNLFSKIEERRNTIVNIAEVVEQTIIEEDIGAGTFTTEQRRELEVEQKRKPEKKISLKAVLPTALTLVSGRTLKEKGKYVPKVEVPSIGSATGVIQVQPEEEEEQVVQLPIQTSTIVSDTIKFNKTIMAVSVASLSLFSLAYSGNLDTAIEMISTTLGGAVNIAIPEIITTGFNYATESQIARFTLFSIISEKVGIQKVIDKFVDKLTPTQKTRLTELDKKISRTRKNKTSYVNEYLDILMGGTRYKEANLKRMTKRELENILKSKNISFVASAGSVSLINAILTDQVERQNNIQSTIAVHLGTATKKVLGATVVGVAYKTIPAGIQQIKQEVNIVKELNKFILETEKIGLTKDQSIIIFDKYAELSRNGILQIKDINIEALKEARSQWSGVTSTKTIEEAEKLATELKVEEKKNVEKIREVYREKLRGKRMEEEATELKKQGQVETEAMKVKHRVKIEKQHSLRSGEKEIEHERRTILHAEKLLKIQLREAIKAEELIERVGLLVANNGKLYSVPKSHYILNEDVMKQLEDAKFTPIGVMLTEQALKSATHWIPGVGWVTKAIDYTNLMLETGQLATATYKVANFITQLTSETGEGKIDIGFDNIRILDNFFSKRIPSLSDVISSISQTTMAKVVKEVALDQIEHGWDMDRFKIELVKKIVGVDEIKDMSSNIINKISEIFMSNK